MYFDAVLNDEYAPLFTGTPEQTKEWLRKEMSAGTLPDSVRVCVGKMMRLVSVSYYLRDQ